MSDNKDLLSPLAVARDEYIVGPGLKHCDPSTLGATSGQRQYLTNRIESAFLAGAKYSDAQLLARCARLLADNTAGGLRELGLIEEKKIMRSALEEIESYHGDLSDDSVSAKYGEGAKRLRSLARAALSPNPEAKP